MKTICVLLCLLIITCLCCLYNFIYKEKKSDNFITYENCLELIIINKVDEVFYSNNNALTDSPKTLKPNNVENMKLLNTNSNITYTVKYNSKNYQLKFKLSINEKRLQIHFYKNVMLKLHSYSSLDRKFFLIISKSTIIPKINKIMIASDPQPWRNENCADPNESKECWEKEMRFAKNFIVNNNYDLIMINGDVTEFGREEQFNSFMWLFNGKNTKRPPLYFFGLGNHDYENNVEDCVDIKSDIFMSKNGCARNMITKLWSNILKNCGTLNNYWFDSEDYGINFKSGSLAFGFDINEIFHFAQFNNHPTYAVRLNHWTKKEFNITDSLNYLEKVCNYTKANNKILILNWHKNFLGDEVEYVINKNCDKNRLLIFFGHSHIFEHYTRNGIKFFNSGALFKGDIISLIIDSNNNCVNIFYENISKAVTTKKQLYEKCY